MRAYMGTRIVPIATPSRRLAIVRDLMPSRRPAHSPHLQCVNPFARRPIHDPPASGHAHVGRFEYGGSGTESPHSVKEDRAMISRTFGVLLRPLALAAAVLLLGG